MRLIVRPAFVGRQLKSLSNTDGFQFDLSQNVYEFLSISINFVVLFCTPNLPLPDYMTLSFYPFDRQMSPPSISSHQLLIKEFGCC